MANVIDIKTLRQSIMNEIADLDRLLGQAQNSCAPVTLDQQSVWRLSRIDAMQRHAMRIALIWLTGATGQNESCNSPDLKDQTIRQRRAASLHLSMWGSLCLPEY